MLRLNGHGEHLPACHEQITTGQRVPAATRLGERIPDRFDCRLAAIDRRREMKKAAWIHPVIQQAQPVMQAGLGNHAPSTGRKAAPREVMTQTPPAPGIHGLVEFLQDLFVLGLAQVRSGQAADERDHKQEGKGVKRVGVRAKDLLGDLSYPSGAYLYAQPIELPVIENSNFLFTTE